MFAADFGAAAAVEDDGLGRDVVEAGYWRERKGGIGLGNNYAVL